MKNRILGGEVHEKTNIEGGGDCLKRLGLDILQI